MHEKVENEMKKKTQDRDQQQPQKNNNNNIISDFFFRLKQITRKLRVLCMFVFFSSLQFYKHSSLKGFFFHVVCVCVREMCTYKDELTTIWAVIVFFFLSFA